MGIKTYFWHDRVLPVFMFQLLRLLRPTNSRFFKMGNAGDLFTHTLINSLYAENVVNSKSNGGRLLLVGSIAHKIKEGDVLCGIGYKGINPPAKLNVQIFSLRGPITYDVFKRKSYDVSSIKSLLDPGLYIKYLVEKIKPVKNKVIFIPHYRERYKHKVLPAGITFVDIDQCPISLANEIMSAEHVYTSSLHGLIFSHSLERSCSLVKPLTNEPLLKFEDYFLSIDKKFPRPLDSIENLNFLKDVASPLHIQLSKDSFYFPDIDFLKRNRIAT